MAPKSRPSPSYRVSSVFSVTIFAHLLFIAVATLVLVWLLKFRGGLAFSSSNKQKIFNLHPLFMVIGFLLLTGEAMMAYWSIPAERQTQKTVHMALNFVALASGIIGVYAVFKFHREINIPDMYSLHSWLGLSALILSGLQWLFGFTILFFPRRETYTRGKYSPWHVLAGLVIYFLMVATALMGLTEKFMFTGLRRSREALIVNFAGLLIVLFAVSVFLTVLHRYW